MGYLFEQRQRSSRCSGFEGRVTVYCDFKDPPCDNWAENLETGWHTIAIAGTEPKTFCCSAHAIIYIRNPMKHAAMEQFSRRAHDWAGYEPSPIAVVLLAPDDDPAAAYCATPDGFLCFDLDNFDTTEQAIAWTRSVLDAIPPFGEVHPLDDPVLYVRSLPKWTAVTQNKNNLLYISFSPFTGKVV